MARFAAIGLDHRHVYDLTEGLLQAGATCVGHDLVTTDPRVLAGFRKRFQDVPAIDRDRLLADPSIDFIVLAARPNDRAGIATATQLEAIRQTVSATTMPQSQTFAVCALALRLQAAAAYGFPVSADAMAAIHDPAVDAVMILTPANAHLEEASIDRAESLVAAAGLLRRTGPGP